LSNLVYGKVAEVLGKGPMLRRRPSLGFGAGSGFFRRKTDGRIPEPGGKAVIMSTLPSYRKPSNGPWSDLEWPSGLPAIHLVTRLPLIFLKMDMTSVLCRSSSDTKICERRWSTLTFWSVAVWVSKVPWTLC